MENEKGKNNFLKKYGLCAVQLTVRLSGWCGQWPGRLAGVEPRLLPLGHSEGFMRLSSKAESPFLPPQDCRDCRPAGCSPSVPSVHQTLILSCIASVDLPTFPGHLLDSRHQGTGSKDVKIAFPRFCTPLQSVLGCPGRSPDAQGRGCHCPGRKTGHGP